MTDDAQREAFKKVLPCHPDVYWHETMKRWVTNGDRLLEAHAYNCRWEGFQAGRAVARAEEPVAYRFTENCGNGKVEYSYYDADKVAGAYRDNCLEITPLYTSPRLPANSVALRNAVIEECARHIEDRNEAFGNTFADEIRELLTKVKP